MKRDIYTGLPIILVGDRISLVLVLVLVLHKILYSRNIDILRYYYYSFVRIGRSNNKKWN